MDYPLIEKRNKVAYLIILNIIILTFLIAGMLSGCDQKPLPEEISELETEVVLTDTVSPPTYTPYNTPEPKFVIITPSTEISSTVTIPSEEEIITNWEDCIPDNEPQNVQLIKVVDGDTIDVAKEGIPFTIKYIGLTSPEATDYWGSFARNKNYELVVNKQLIYIPALDDNEGFDELLGYVIADGELVNLELLKSGFATAGYGPFQTKCDKLFIDAENSARSEAIGMWISSGSQDTEGQASSSQTTGGSMPVGNIVIADIKFSGDPLRNESDEYVEIRNDDRFPIQLEGWALRDNSNNVFFFPNFIIASGQSCRIYTNENHPESCGFNFGISDTAIWNDDGDCAYIRDSEGDLTAHECY